RDRAHDTRACALSRFDDALGRLVQDTVLIGFQPDAEFLLGHVFSSDFVLASRSHLEGLTDTTRSGCNLPAPRVTYSRISVMTPAPTVRPPSRMANLEPRSRATGVMSSTIRLTLSPGMTISTPSGRVMVPVTSMVRM